MIDPKTPDYERIEAFLDHDLPDDDAARVADAIERHPAWREAHEAARSNRSLQDRLRSLGVGADGAPEADDSPPIEIPGFDILHELHRGGQGVVYAAHQHSTGRRVALKLLLHGRLATPMQRRRFEREVDLAASLDHPNIVKVFDRAEAPSGEPYYVMELVEGRPLDAHLREHAIPRRARLELFRTIADAVSSAHQHGVIHRDLKPANILIDERGQPRVLDFGLAKPADLAATESVATEAGGFVGTLRYASPEQLQSAPDTDRRLTRLDVRADVYSLSVILFEMITGRLPYAEEAPLSALVRSITSDEPVRPRAIASGIDADLETILLKGLEKDPERRYQSASELAADIDRFLRDQPITARPPTAAYQLRKFARRHKPLVIAAAASLVILVAALVAVSVSLVQTARARDAAQRRFDQVHTLARTFIYDVHDDIANLPGATRARQNLVDTALRYLDSLADEAEHDRDLLLDLAKAYDRIGDVQGNPDTPNLGDLPGALASYTKALDLRRRLVARAPGDLETRRALGISHEHIGNIQMYMGESGAGVASFRSALDELRAVAGEAAPALRTEVLRDVGALQMKLGRALIVTGADDEARESIAGSLETRRALAERAPGRQDLQRELSQSHVTLGDELRYAGDLNGALEQYLAAESIRARLVELQPGNATALRDLAVVHNRVGNVYLDREEFDRAMEVYDRYHEACLTLADADPDNAEARRDLSVSLEKLADVRLEAGRPADAIPYFDRCIAVREALVGEYPGNARFAQDLSIGVQLRGNARMAMGDPRGARVDYERSLGLRAPLSGADPDNARLRNLVMSAHYKIAESHAAEADDASLPATDRAESYRAARASFERALGIVSALEEAGALTPSSADLPREIAERMDHCDAAIEALTDR